MADKPPISDDMIKTMTAEQLSRARIALRMKIEIPPGSEKTHEILVVPTRDVKRFAGKAPIVVTYTELEGVCRAHSRTQDPGLGIEALEGIARFRESAAAQGLTLMATAVVADGEDLPEIS